MTNTTTPAPQAKSSAGRRVALSLLGLVVLVGLLAWGGYWIAIGQNHVSTDDAYVSGDVIQISSEIPGTVTAIHVDNTQTASANEPLLELDPADAKVEMSAAEANLALAVRQVRTLFARADQLRAETAEKQAQLQRTVDDYRRRSALVSAGGISREELSHAHEDIDQLSASVDAAQADYAATEVQISGTTVSTHPTVLAAEARLRDAALALHRTQITSPIDGVVAERSVQVGQRVDAGTPLMAVIPLRDLWIDANFKEVQLAHIRVGQPALIHTDVYGGDVVFHGRVAGVAAGSGSTFALLPAQNATGNWIKIIQRLPVRILIDPQELVTHPLRLGLSTTVDIDLTAPLRATGARSYPLPSKPSDGDDPATSALIARIIADNAGGSQQLSEAAP